MRRLQKPSAAATNTEFIQHMWPLNFHFSYWWIWPSLKVSAALDCKQERDEWIKTAWKTTEMLCSFFHLWTHLTLFSARTRSRLPVAVCYCWWNSVRSWRLNAQLVFECRTGPLLLGFLSSASLCVWVDVALLSCFKWFKSPQGAHLQRLAFRSCIYMSFTLFWSQ